MKSLKYFFLFIIPIFLFVSCSIFKKQENMMFSETQVCGDTIVNYHTSPIRAKVKSDTLYYFWAKSGKVQSTQGGYYGRLLNGDYNITVSNKLTISGQFKNGLKHGVWKEWENNRIISSFSWRKGLLHGKFSTYDDNGKPENSGKYRKGKLVKPMLWWFGGKKE